MERYQIFVTTRFETTHATEPARRHKLTRVSVGLEALADEVGDGQVALPTLPIRCGLAASTPSVRVGPNRTVGLMPLNEFRFFGLMTQVQLE